MFNLSNIGDGLKGVHQVLPVTLKIMSSISPSIEDLPGTVIADILSRLPVKTIIHCKCVCKKWREYVSLSYFVNLHLSRSPTCLMYHHNILPEMSSDEEEMFLELYGPVVGPGILKWLEIQGERDDTRLHHDPVMNFDLELAPTLQKYTVSQVGSVNGLVCLRTYLDKNDNACICNPITREYMILPKHNYYTKDYSYTTWAYGFGVGLLTNEYKVIRVFHGDILPNPTIEMVIRNRAHLIEAEVYTLGTGEWRPLGQVPYWLELSHGNFGTFLNGHVHWVVDKDSPDDKICDFDVDNETFQLFPSPPSEYIEGKWRSQCLGVLNGCLSQCDATSFDFTIWVMKEYGIKNSWHKEVVINQSIRWDDEMSIRGPVHLMESLEDGTILMLLDWWGLLVYCPRKETMKKREFFARYLTGMAYRPSFIKLQTFESESVHVL